MSNAETEAAREILKQIEAGDVPPQQAVEAVASILLQLLPRK